MAEHEAPFELTEDEEFKSSGQYAAVKPRSTRHGRHVHWQTATREQEDRPPRVGFERIATGEEVRHDKEGEPGIAGKLAVTYRRPMFVALLLINLAWIAITVALAVNSLDPINDDNLGEVGLFIPDEEYQQRSNAYSRAKNEANLGLTSAKCPREDAADPIELVVMRGSFTLQGNSGNAFTPSGLKRLRKREDKILRNSGWKGRCAGVYLTRFPECNISSNLQQPTADGLSTFTASDVNGCLKAFSPVYFFDKYGDPDFEDLGGTVQKIIATSETDWLSLQDMLHKDFTPENLESKVLVSKTYAGTPRKAVADYVDDRTLKQIENGRRYKYYTDRRERNEREHLGNWIDREFNGGDGSSGWMGRNFKRKPWRTLYSYPEYDPVKDQVERDLLLVGGSIIIVFCYMWYSTASLFVTGVGLIMIFCSFFGANLLYRYCWPNEGGLGYNFFTVFSALSLFIIMGIGADDIFVFWDTWTASAPLAYKSEAHRLHHVFAHAAGAMLVTSTTTILSFLSNLSSPFVGIRTFGVFAALLVFVNFCAVSTLFPLTVLVYHKYMSHRQYVWKPLTDRAYLYLWLPLVASLSKLFRKQKPTEEEAGGDPSTTETPLDDAGGAAGAAAGATTKDEKGAATPAAGATKDEKGGVAAAGATATANDEKGGVAAASPDEPPPSRSAETEEEKEGPAEEPTEEQHGSDEDEEEDEEMEEAFPRWFKKTYAPWLFRWKKSVVGFHFGLWAVFVAMATQLEVTPFEEYELLPIATNFHQYTYSTRNWLPKSADPLFAHVTFGLEHRDPLSYTNSEQRFVPEESGSVNWDTSLNFDRTQTQMQMIRTADEFAFTPRRKLHVENKAGINSQLSGSRTGSLEDTPDGGASSSVQNSYGIQSFFHALRQWENVSEADDRGAGSFVRKAQPLSKCRSCFETFTYEPNVFDLCDGLTNCVTGEVPDFTLNATSPLTPLCNCYGFYPLAGDVCLEETAGSPDGTRFKCTDALHDTMWFEMISYFGSANSTQDSNWWRDYIFAESDDFGDYDRLAFYDIQVQTTIRRNDGDFKMGLRMAHKWDDWMDDYNEKSENEERVMIYLENSEKWVVSSILLPSGITNMLVSLALAWVVLTFATGNYITSSIATFTIGMIASIILGLIHVIGWGLGTLESILIVIVVGFSVDYTVHLADSYTGSHAQTREGRVCDALTHTGVSVVSGAASTLGASIPMLFAQIIFFYKFGIFMFATIGLSLIYSLGFFMGAMACIGPLGMSGQLVTLYANCIKRTHENIQELEAEQKVLNERQEKERRHEKERLLGDEKPGQGDNEPTRPATDPVV